MDGPLSLTDRVAPAPDVVFRALGDEAVVVSLDGGLYFGLDEVGARIWALLEHHDLGGVARALTAEYDVSRARAEEDVITFTEGLVARHLVVRVHGG